MSETRICKRCLIGDIPDQASLAELIRERIALLPEDQKADEALMASRLDACRACDHLNSGTCALCGCYVELRAAKRHMRCPDVPARWT